MDRKEKMPAPDQCHGGDRCVSLGENTAAIAAESGLTHVDLEQLDLRQQITVLENQLIRQKLQNEELLGLLNQQCTRNSELKENNARQKKTIEAYDSKITGLRSRVRTLEDQLKASQVETDDAFHHATEWEIVVDGLKKQIAKLELENRKYNVENRRPGVFLRPVPHSLHWGLSDPEPATHVEHLKANLDRTKKALDRVPLTPPNADRRSTTKLIQKCLEFYSAQMKNDQLLKDLLDQCEIVLHDQREFLERL